MIGGLIKFKFDLSFLIFFKFPMVTDLKNKIKTLECLFFYSQLFTFIIYESEKFRIFLYIERWFIFFKITYLLLVIILIKISDKNILFSDKNILFRDKYFFQ